MRGQEPQRATMDVPNALPWRVEKLLEVPNAAECPRCHDMLVSHHIHDFKACRCGEIFIDGGLTCPRRGGDARPMFEWRVMGWFSHRWKAERAIRRAFGPETRVVAVPDNDFMQVWAATKHIDLRVAP